MSMVVYPERVSEMSPWVATSQVKKPLGMTFQFPKSGKKALALLLWNMIHGYPYPVCTHAWAGLYIRMVLPNSESSGYHLFMRIEKAWCTFICTEWSACNTVEKLKVPGVYMFLLMLQQVFHNRFPIWFSHFHAKHLLHLQNLSKLWSFLFKMKMCMFEKVLENGDKGKTISFWQWFL